ncbi:MAG: AAA family ATPase [Candidatus Aenigmarchaeota archaeon]|nr:AAA family ATPase [Candidatus Aenigmarchaeota archaeon]
MDEIKPEDIQEIPSSVDLVSEELSEPAQIPEKQPQNTGPKPSSEAPLQGVQEWLVKMGWSDDPFTFNILPSLFVGYKPQTETLINTIQEKHKIILLLGPTGSGKTTTLRWVIEHPLAGFDYLYVAKPPKQPDDFVHVLNEKYKTPWYLQWIIPHIKNIYQVPEFLNERTEKKHLVVLYDEAHESDIDVLEWLRVLCDQVANMTVILAGLPVFEQERLSELETLRKRIMTKISLLSLTKEETTELIRKRIRDVGGKGDEFTDETIDLIYARTEGFPREIIRLANEVVNQAIRQSKTVMTPDLLEGSTIEQQTDIVSAPSVKIIEALTPMQRDVMEMLMHPLTPGQIANVSDLSKYKSRQHAVRSMNNILKSLMDLGIVERAKHDRAFVYQLKQHVKSLIIKA